MLTETLWKVLGKLGCPDHFVKLIRSLHDEMEVSVNVGGILTGPFQSRNWCKAGRLTCTNTVFFSMDLVAHKESDM